MAPWFCGSQGWLSRRQDDGNARCAPHGALMPHVAPVLKWWPLCQLETLQGRCTRIGQGTCTARNHVDLQICNRHRPVILPSEITPVAALANRAHDSFGGQISCQVQAKYPDFQRHNMIASQCAVGRPRLIAPQTSTSRRKPVACAAASRQQQVEIDRKI